MASHGHTSGGKTTPTYNSWKAMLRRCYNANYDQYMYYGGRGIQVCAQWRGKNGFKTFLTDMGERPKGESLDREYNNGNYTPNNCKWSTPLEQAHNRRKDKSSHKGEQNNKSKLTVNQVLEIRKLQGLERLCNVARQYNTTPQNIYRIWTRRTWGHI